MVVRRKLVLIVSATLEAVQDEESPGNEFENDRDHKACESGIVGRVFLRSAIGIIVPSLVDVGEVAVGAV